MNEPGKTEAAPGFGSIYSPVVIVGQSLCEKCMETKVPFTGGSGRYIDDALDMAHRKKAEIFITNVVHCHPEGDRASYKHEIDNCRGYLHQELEIVQPRLAIGLGDDAKAELRRYYYENSTELAWPFVEPLKQKNTVYPYLLFPEHPGSLRFKKTLERAYYSPSLADAIKWAFKEA
ncbi:uracil-DNA glycosylase family protein [Mycobacterium avium]|uniref:uracil-DNA glycosylase family protein n=1 Tax=Mycobacterium avium TaxID=1764 RepID=UPI00111BCE8B|nr:uracil-DNA glycosylase family protein [Mycobacterium avium]